MEVGIIVAIVAALGTYLVAARQFSGRIQTSDATELWQESRAIREWSTGQLNELRERVVTLEAENRRLTDDLRAAHEEIRILKGGRRT